MKIVLTFVLAGLFIACSGDLQYLSRSGYYGESADRKDLTNDFYDNEETVFLGIPTMEIAGEIANPGTADLSGLPLRSVIVKETVYDEEGNKFIGAYRYDGYSLYDILNLRRLDKKNGARFAPIIDLYVEIENDKGEKTVISWGEIYYPNHLHEIIIATRVMRIVPSKTKDLWPLPTSSRLIVGTDLVSERNLEDPVKITVRSYDMDLTVTKNKKPLYSPSVDIFVRGKKAETLRESPPGLAKETYQTVFYGRGRGIHGITPFTGIKLKDYFRDKIVKNRSAVRRGIFMVTAADGYRALFSYSEICNRNDQADVLLVCEPKVKDNGIFNLFPACDFFSDRAVKAITAIRYFELEEI